MTAFVIFKPNRSDVGKLIVERSTGYSYFLNRLGGSSADIERAFGPDQHHKWEPRKHHRSGRVFRRRIRDIQNLFDRPTHGAS